MPGSILNWFSPEGRISRKDYWLQVIVPCALVGLAFPVFSMLGPVLRRAEAAAVLGLMLFLPIGGGALLVYSQRISALTIRRYHDLGKKGGWHIKSPGRSLMVMLGLAPLL